MIVDPIDLLNSLGSEELANVDTSFPLLKPGQYEFVVDSVEIKDSNSGGKFISISAKLNEDAETTAGEPLKPGYPVRHMINLTPSQKQIENNPRGVEGCVENIKKDIAKFLDATVGPSRYYDPSFQVYRGQTFFAKTRVSKERTDERTGQTYDPQTEFATLIPKTEDVDAVAVNSAYANTNPF